MRCRSWVIITPPKRDDPIYASERFTVFLPQSGFVQQAISLIEASVSKMRVLSVIAMLRQLSQGERYPRLAELVDNWTVKHHHDKRQPGRSRVNPSWHGLRLANMPMPIWLTLLALLLGGFLAVLLHK